MEIVLILISHSLETQGYIGVLRMGEIRNFFLIAYL